MGDSAMRRVAVAFVLALCACRQPTELEVDISSTDLPCAAPSELQFTALSLVASPKPSGLLDGEPAARSTACTLRGSSVDLGSLTLFPRPETQRAEILVAAGVTILNADGTELRGDEKMCVEAYRDFLRHPETHCRDHCDPCVVATRSVGFVSHEKLALGIELTAECRGVFCAAGQTCGANGACVSNESACAAGRCRLGGAGGAGGAGGTGGGGSGGAGSSSGGAGGATGAPGECHTNVDCPPDGACIELIAGGYRVCQYPVVEATSCNGVGDLCCNNAGCNLGERCINEPFPACTTVTMRPYNRCVKDLCAGDGDCAGGEICAPAGTFNDKVRVCVPALCKQPTYPFTGAGEATGRSDRSSVPDMNRQGIERWVGSGAATSARLS